MTDSRSEIKNVRPLRRPVKSPLDRRWAVEWYADLHTQGDVLPSMVENVSADGAQLRVGGIPIDGESVSFVLLNCSPVEARIAWRRSEHIGIQFLTRQSWIIDLVLGVTETEECFPVTVA
jgi:hypothetical protein